VFEKKVIAAEGEQKASHALREAADIISQSPSAIQLRYLQVKIAFKALTLRSFLTLNAI